MSRRRGSTSPRAARCEGPVDAVVHVHHAPLPLQAPAVLPAVAGAPAVVDVEDGDAPAGPVLGAQDEGGGGGGGGAPVALDQERREVAGGRLGVTVGGRVVEGVGRLPPGGGERDGAGDGEVGGVNADVAAAAQDVVATGLGVDADEGRGLVRGAGVEDDAPVREGAQVTDVRVGEGNRIQAGGGEVEAPEAPGALLGEGADERGRGEEAVGGGAEDPLGLAELGRAVRAPGLRAGARLRWRGGRGSTSRCGRRRSRGARPAPTRAGRSIPGALRRRAGRPGRRPPG